MKNGESGPNKKKPEHNEHKKKKRDGPVERKPPINELRNSRPGRYQKRPRARGVRGSTEGG